MSIAVFWRLAWLSWRNCQIFCYSTWTLIWPYDLLLLLVWPVYFWYSSRNFTSIVVVHISWFELVEQLIPFGLKFDLKHFVGLISMPTSKSMGHTLIQLRFCSTQISCKRTKFSPSNTEHGLTNIVYDWNSDIILEICDWYWLWTKDKFSRVIIDVWH